MSREISCPDGAKDISEGRFEEPTIDPDDDETLVPWYNDTGEFGESTEEDDDD
jgi:hypothetical protein